MLGYLFYCAALRTEGLSLFPASRSYEGPYEGPMRVIYQDSPGVGYRVYASWFKAHHPKPRSCLRSGFEAFLAVPVQCQSFGFGVQN